MPLIALECVPVGDVETNCYLVENRETGDVLIVDPGAEAEKIIQAVGSRTPVAVLLTHGHFDHLGAADAVCGQYHIPLYVHELDLPKLTDPKGNCSQRFGYRVVVRTPGQGLKDGQVLRLGGMEVTVLHTPGHSAGSCSYLLPEGQGVLTGDTLFDGGYGRTDFEDGSFAALKASLRKLLFMRPRRAAYPGHGGSTVAGQDEESL